MTLDIAPFAYRDDDPAERRLVLRWEEPRELHRVSLVFVDGDTLPAPKDVQVYYWRHYWPQERVTTADLSKGRIGGLGWKARDDWFNGEWAKADTQARVKGREITITFAPLARREFPDLKDYSVRFRQAIQLRIDLPEGCATPQVRVYTDTPVHAREIAVETGCGQSQTASDVQVQVYNGSLEELRRPDDEDPRFHLQVLCTHPGSVSYDHTIVTLRCPAFAMSFRPEDLDEGQPVWVPDLGVLVSESKWNLRYSDEVAANLRTGVSRYEAIAAEPEQALARARREQPPKDPMHFIVGCEGGRQKFGIAPNGDIVARVGFVRSVPGADTPRMGWEGDAFALRFEWDDWQRSGRRIARGYLPIHEARFSHGNLDANTEAFATPINQSIMTNPIAGDDPVACLVRLIFVNNGEDKLHVNQPLRFMTYDSGRHSPWRNLGEPTRRERLEVSGDLVYAVGDTRYLRMAIDTGGAGELAADEDGLTYRVVLAAGQRHSITLKIPFLGLLDPSEARNLGAKDFDTERREVTRFWEDRIAGAARIETPVPDVTDFYRAHLTHILINDDREVGSDRLMGRVSSFAYGNFSNESIMQIMELDRRGLHNEARRHLDTYLHYQGTVALPGNFRTIEGVFYGSGGYEHGGYNQHHGWVLWGMAEHYRFTDDRAWLLSIADKLIAGCNWITRERQATMRTDGQGRRVLEYGFLPAGWLEDVKDFYYWLSTNALTSRGFTVAAQVLAEVGHPEGERLVREAAAYRDDVLAGFRESMARSPVVRLRDGTYVPHHPSRLYWRGRDFGWIREVLEGSVNLVTAVLDPNSQEATWVLKDYEDNRYLDAPYNYPLDDFDGQWFSRGGFSMQPNLLYFTPPYLLRDQIEHFLRAFFNGFAACWRADIRAMTEHPLPTLADWAGDHFKSSDEAMVAMWLRMMFIQEDGDTLYLGRGLPREWLASDEGVAIRDAMTYSGRMSLEMRPLNHGARIVARIDPPLRKPPKRIVLRFRHPEKAMLAAVSMNGRGVIDIDRDKEWVVLPALTEATTVEATFERKGLTAG